MLQWTDKQDGIDDVLAEDINSIANELINAQIEQSTIKTALSSLKLNLDNLSENKADKSDTLAGYGIGDAYTKEETEALVRAAGGAGFPDELKVKYDAATLQAMYNEVIEPSPDEWFIFDANTKTITGMNYEEYGPEYSTIAITDLVFPFQINGVIVENIGQSGTRISVTPNIKNVRLPNCVKKIGAIAFDNNKYMETINIPTSCTWIDVGAFASCEKLKEVITPVKPNWELRIGNTCFASCGSLNNIDTIIDGIKTIPYTAFSYASVKNVIIPESVEEMKSNCFGATMLNCITILNMQCKIDADAFDNSVNTTLYHLPNVIKGYNNSTAETFANDHDIPFIALDEDVIDTAMSIAITEASAAKDEMQSYVTSNYYDKTEINNKIGDISTALTELHAYAENTYLGGETE